MKDRYVFSCGCSFDVIEPGIDGKKPCLDFQIDRDTNYNCQAVWDLYAKGLTVGTFQISTSLGRRYCRIAKPTSIQHIADLTAILRPGCLEAKDESGKSLTQKYCDRKNGLEPISIEFSAVADILEDTYQVLIYQEQQIAFGERLAGFTKAEADTLLRKNIGKKLASLLFAIETQFVEGCIKVGLVDEPQARKIFSWLKAAARYNFNRSHSASYGVTALKTAYLKSHFPLAFYKGKLNGARHKPYFQDVICDLVNDAKLFNITVNLPSFKDIRENFYIKNGEIYFGITNVKGLGVSSVNKIQIGLTAFREKFPDKDIALLSVDELLVKFFLEYVSDSITEKLITAGAFNYFGLTRTEILNKFRLLSWLNEGEREKLKELNPEMGDFEQFLAAIARPKKENGIFSTKARMASFISSVLVWRAKPTYDDPLWTSFVEQDLLGVAITCNRVDAYDTSMANMTLKAFIVGETRDFMVFACDILQVDERVIMKGEKEGQKWATLQLTDGTAKMAANVWSEEYERSKEILDTGASVIIMGERGRGKYSDNLVIKRVERARNALDADSSSGII